MKMPITDLNEEHFDLVNFSKHYDHTEYYNIYCVF